MTDDEIYQYLEAIKPIYTKEMQASASRIRERIKVIDEEYRKLNRLTFSQPPVEVKDQATSEKEQERQAVIVRQKNELRKERDKLRTMQHMAPYSAKKRGIQGEWNNLSEMPRKEISDIQQQAELLNILDNSCHQLAQVCKFIKDAGVSQGYNLSFGDITDLRGAWEDAVSAVCLRTADGKVLQEKEHTGNRDSDLQNAANTLAGEWQKENHKHITKRNIAKALSLSDEWKGMTEGCIERIIRKKW